MESKRSRAKARKQPLLPQKDTEPLKLSGRAKRRNMNMLFVGFIATFMGLTTANSFAHTYTGDFGTPSVAAYYIAAVLACGIVPAYLLRTMGARITLSASGWVVSAYLCSLAYYIGPLAFFGSSLSGIASAVIWTAMPCELNRAITEKTRGTFNALLWGAFKLSEVPGDIIGVSGFKFENKSNAGDADKANSMEWMVRGWKEPDSAVFLSLIFLCIGGSCCFMGLRVNPYEYFVAKKKRKRLFGNKAFKETPAPRQRGAGKSTGVVVVTKQAERRPEGRLVVQGHDDAANALVGVDHDEQQQRQQPDEAGNESESSAEDEAANSSSADDSDEDNAPVLERAF
jgi:hypothetical protein